MVFMIHLIVLNLIVQVLKIQDLNRIKERDHLDLKNFFNKMKDMKNYKD